MSEQYGPPIAINGKRPEWLRYDDQCMIIIAGRESRAPRKASQWALGVVQKICLPIGHPASICQQFALDHPDAEPFIPWHVNGTVPGDYDGGEVLLRSGYLGCGNSWNDQGWSTIVGYRRKPAAQDIPTCSPERFASAPTERMAAALGVPFTRLDRTTRIAELEAQLAAAHERADRNGVAVDIAHRDNPHHATFDTRTHVAVPLMTYGEIRERVASALPESGWTSEIATAHYMGAAEFCRLSGIIRPDPITIEAISKEYGVPIEKLQALCRMSPALSPRAVVAIMLAIAMVACVIIVEVLS